MRVLLEGELVRAQNAPESRELSQRPRTASCAKEKPRPSGERGWGDDRSSFLSHQAIRVRAIGSPAGSPLKWRNSGPKKRPGRYPEAALGNQVALMVNSVPYRCQQW